MRRFWKQTAIALGGVSLVVGSVVGACSVYDKSLLLPAAPPDAAQADAPVEAGDDGGCALARPPPKPPGPDGPSRGRIVVAVDSLRIDNGADTPDGSIAAAIGLDIDGVCTCPGPESCVAPPGSSAASASARCDGEGGRDNAAGKLFTTFAKLSPAFQPTKLKDGIERGLNTMVGVLVDYNGTKNDPQVTFALYLSAGTDLVRLDGGTGEKPKFDGTDRWTIATGSLISGASLEGTDCETNTNCIAVPQSVDPDAYVVDGLLVAHIDLPVGISETFILNITRATLTARIEPAGSSFRLAAGEATGRVSTAAVLTALANVGDPIGSGNLCGDSGTYKTVKQEICASADVNANPANDGKNAPCDALAASVSFTASPARLGTVISPGPGKTSCPGWRDTCE